MIGPLRSLYAIRPGAPLPLVLSAIAVTVMFTATPFLIPELATRYGVSEGVAATISIAQVGSFAATTLLLPRMFNPSGTILRAASILFLAANGLSALLANFTLLVSVRAIAGGSAGVLTWIIWTDAMRSSRSLATISSIGPLTALVGAPVIALIAEAGDQAVYGAMALASTPATLVAKQAPPATRARRRISRSRSNRVLLFALLLVTLAGTSMFIFEAVAAREVLGLDPVLASAGFSLNAAGGLLGARLAARHRRPGRWLASAGIAVFLTIGGGHPIAFYIGMAWWGFAFWMGIPGVLQMLADRSLEPGERAGDAQGYMAIGRAIAPGIGGAFADSGAFLGLAIFAGVGVAASGAVVMAVQEGRASLPPTAPLAPRR